jgi:hypothetical protein
MRFVATSFLALALCGAAAQELHLDTGSRHAARQHVELLDEGFVVEAGKPQEIELRFRVAPNLHINSHMPKDELLLPTTLKFDSAPRPLVTKEDFPAGHPFHLAVGAGETLDVYQNEFRVRVHLAVPAGETKLEGQLRYQACDTASCLPPQTLPIHLVVLGK